MIFNLFLLGLLFTAGSAERLTRAKKQRISNDYVFNDTITEYYEHVIKPANDKSNYLHLTLNNDLQVLLVSNPEAQVAAVSMNVEVGSRNDPIEFPGLAHFCEHMLFMGSSKYPDVEKFMSFVNEQGGQSNAFTADQVTNYHFEVKPAALNGSLDIFAQFFIDPIFDGNYVIKEASNVEQEYEMGLNSDGWKYQHVIKNISNPQHPSNRFNCGNTQTLIHGPKAKGLDIRKEVVEWYKSHYSSHLMKLVVSSNAPLKNLTEMVLQNFPKIQKRNIKIEQPTVSKWNTEMYQKIVQVQTVMDVHSLVFKFHASNFTSADFNYASHLVGYEGRGSILSLLKKKGLAVELASGYDHDDEEFQIQIGLTPQGWTNYKQVVDLIMQGIEMFKNAGFQEWIFMQNAIKERSEFEMEQPEYTFDSIADVSQSMSRNPKRTILNDGGFLIEKTSPEKMMQALKSLNPEKSMLMLLSADPILKNKQTEFWYKTDFSVSAYPRTLIVSLKNPKANKALHMPYMVIDLAELEAESDYKEPMQVDSNLPDHPLIVFESSKMRLWHKIDQKYQIPKIALKIKIVSDQVSKDSISQLKASIFAAMINENLNEFSYEMEGRLSFAIVPEEHGFRIEIIAKTHLLAAAAKEIIDATFKFTPNQKAFDAFKSTTLQQLKSIHKLPVRNQNSLHWSSLMDVDHEHPSATIKQLESIKKVKEIAEFGKNALKNIKIRALAFGNLNSEEAKQLGEFLDKLIPSGDQVSQLNLKQFRMMPEHSNYILRKKNSNPEDNNVFVDYRLQVGYKTDYASVMKLQLLSVMTSNFCFEDLRTQQTLGYAVGCGLKSWGNIVGFSIFVQSSAYTPADIELRMEGLISKFQKHLDSISQGEFDNYKDSIIHQLKMKPSDFDEEADEHFVFSLDPEHHHQHDEMLIGIVEKIDFDQVKQFYRDYVSMDATHRRKLSIHIDNTENQLIQVPGVRELYQRNKVVTSEHEILSEFAFQEPGRIPQVPSDQFYLKNII